MYYTETMSKTVVFPRAAIRRSSVWGSIASTKRGRPFQNRHERIPRAVFTGFIRELPLTITRANRHTREGSFKRRTECLSFNTTRACV